MAAAVTAEQFETNPWEQIKARIGGQDQFPGVSELGDANGV